MMVDAGFLHARLHFRVQFVQVRAGRALEYGGAYGMQHTRNARGHYTKAEPRRPRQMLEVIFMRVIKM